MRALILDGFPEKGKKENILYEQMNQVLKKKGHALERIFLRDLSIRYCIGCWNCWVKTPGICVFKDDMVRLYPKIIQSDVLIFSSPVILGFTSALLKKVEDRMIPLLHPYIEIVQGECHHRKRYNRYPKLGLILDPRGEGEKNLDLIVTAFRRLSINFRSSLEFTGTVEQPDEVLHAIDSL